MSTFTKKHYDRIAKCLGELNYDSSASAILDALVEMFKEDNESFDEARFRQNAFKP